MNELRETLGFGLRMIGFMILPAMVGLIALRRPIVHVVFEHGAFSAADTQGTAAALLAYAVGLWAFAGTRVIVAVFYALQDTKTPAVTAVIAMLVNVGVAVMLMKPFAHAGLALATALSAMVNVGALDNRADPSSGRHGLAGPVSLAGAGRAGDDSGGPRLSVD